MTPRGGSAQVCSSPRGGGHKGRDGFTPGGHRGWSRRRAWGSRGVLRCRATRAAWREAWFVGALHGCCKLTGARGFVGGDEKPENDTPFCLLLASPEPARTSEPWPCPCDCEWWCPADDWPRPTRHMAPPRLAAPLTAATASRATATGEGNNTCEIRQWPRDIGTARASIGWGVLRVRSGLGVYRRQAWPNQWQRRVPCLGPETRRAQRPLPPPGWLPWTTTRWCRSAPRRRQQLQLQPRRTCPTPCSYASAESRACWHPAGHAQRALVGRRGERPRRIQKVRGPQR